MVTLQTVSALWLSTLLACTGHEDSLSSTNLRWSVSVRTASVGQPALPILATVLISISFGAKRCISVRLLLGGLAALIGGLLGGIALNLFCLPNLRVVRLGRGMRWHDLLRFVGGRAKVRGTLPALVSWIFRARPLLGASFRWISKDARSSVYIVSTWTLPEVETWLDHADPSQYLNSKRPVGSASQPAGCEGSPTPWSAVMPSDPGPAPWICESAAWYALTNRWTSFSERPLPNPVYGEKRCSSRELPRSHT